MLYAPKNTTFNVCGETIEIYYIVHVVCALGEYGSTDNTLFMLFVPLESLGEQRTQLNSGVTDKSRPINGHLLRRYKIL